MATNLRLSQELEEAVRAEAARTGLSQQDVIRSSLRAVLIDGASGTPIRRPYRRPRYRITLPEGMTSLDLLDRDDRI